MADIFNQFKRTWNDGKAGFGRHSYAAARAAGYSNAQIQASLGGYRVGKRARDMIGAGIQAESAAQASISAANSRANSYQSQLSNYQNQVSNFQSQMSGYQNQISNLTNQYNTQLTATKTAQDKAKEAQGLADEFQEKFNQKSADYDMAKQEADTYREQAVGQQLRALRSGATSGGANQKRTAAVGGLTGGEQAFEAPRERSSEITEMAKAEGGLTDSVLRNKGPVVERINSADRTQSTRRRSTSGLARGAGTSSHYSSRFG